jgi:hypothetical protein
MADGWLAQPEGCCEMADARLVVRLRLDQAKEPQSGWSQRRRRDERREPPVTEDGLADTALDPVWPTSAAKVTSRPRSCALPQLQTVISIKLGEYQSF